MVCDLSYNSAVDLRGWREREAGMEDVGFTCFLLLSAGVEPGDSGGTPTQGFRWPWHQLSGSSAPPALHRQPLPGRQTGWNSKQGEKHLNISSVFG